MFNFRTDLAVERRDIFKRANKLENEIEGIESEEEKRGKNVIVNRVKVTSKEGEEAIGKPIGNYITVDIKKLKLAQEEEIKEASEVVAEELRKIIDLNIDKKGDILVVGLGNSKVTPDALRTKSCTKY